MSPDKTNDYENYIEESNAEMDKSILIEGLNKSKNSPFKNDQKLLLDKTLDST